MTGFHLGSLWSFWRLWMQRFEAWCFKAKGHFGTWWSYTMLFESTQSGAQPRFGRGQTMRTPNSYKESSYKVPLLKRLGLFFLFKEKWFKASRFKIAFFLRSLLLNRSNSSSTDGRLSCHDPDEGHRSKRATEMKLILKEESKCSSFEVEAFLCLVVFLPPEKEQILRVYIKSAQKGGPHNGILAVFIAFKKNIYIV